MDRFKKLFTPLEKAPSARAELGKREKLFGRGLKPLPNFLTGFTPTGYKIGFLITILSLIIYGIDIPFFHIMELKAYDLHFLSRGIIEPTNEVIIVAIDEKSLDRFGRWPWPRTRIAELVDKLKEYEAKVVAFDIVFAEPDESSGINVIRGLKDRLKGKGREIISTIETVEKESDNDLKLTSSLKNNPSVILGYFFFTSPEEIKHIKKGQGSGVKGQGYIRSSRYTSVRNIEKGAPVPELLNAVGIQENIPAIADAAVDSGYFNIAPDADGTVRWLPLAVKYKDNFYPHLSLSAVRKYFDSPPLILNAAGYGVDSINIGNLNIPTDERGRLLINYRGHQRTFPHYSFSDVVEGVVPAGLFKDRIVLVGATATGIYDMKVTPFGASFPGIEIHANVIDNILSQDFILRPDWVAVFDISILLLNGILLSIVIPKIKPVYTAIITIALICFYIILNNYIFNNWHLWLTEVYPVFSIILVSGGVTIFQFMTEEKKKREIRKAFSHYVSPSLVNEIVKDPKKLILGGEEKRLTVLFSDIRGFTTVSETLKPDALVKLINDYLTPMTDIVLKNGGTIDKYMGDAIMAFWGAPIWQEDHQTRACRTALEMLKKLAELQVIWEKAGIPKFEIGVGISTGRVTVGNMGSDIRFDYTIMGDTVNLGSRLEGLNKEYGTFIIVPKYTYEDVKGDFIFRQLDWVKVKGKDRPIKIYELMGENSNGSGLRGIAEKFESGLNSYMEREWDKAEVYFQDVIKIKPNDKPSSVFISRIKELRKTDLPSNWDGVYVMTKK
ncbi:MAG: adenylate/guanylate cyclase domain-containing protein [Nitrospinae bacterium]|nr:adenylate/guanylate cyclase domain-containing protein [Nitrospinota bacterium]